MTMKEKRDVQSCLSKRFHGAHIAYPRGAARQAEFYRRVDAMKAASHRHLTDTEAEAAVIETIWEK